MWGFVSNSYSLSPWEAIKAKSELEFCAADCRAGRPTISQGTCNGRGHFDLYSEGGRGNFLSEVGRWNFPV